MDLELKDTSGLEVIQRDLQEYCTTIGNRMAGSPDEKKAAEFTKQRFLELGMDRVEMLPFSCTRWIPDTSEILLDGNHKQSVSCVAYAHTVATPPEGVEGELVIFEPVDWELGIRHTDLAGKIALIHGTYGESTERFQELHESSLKALIFVDTRFQTKWPIANGVGEKFMKLIRKPMVSVSLMDAWDIVRNGIRSATVVCRGERRESSSWNVVGEFPGSPAGGRIMLLSGHLDTVSVGPGADDNASGMTAVLECARRLKDAQTKHTIRFAGFGAEEQLSVGSMRYVAGQAKDLQNIAFVCNFDGIGAWAGNSIVMTTGTRALDAYIENIITHKQRFGSVRADVSPYQDQYPFTIHGIPGIWYSRVTNSGSCWYHHSNYNNLEVCSPEQIARTAESACEILCDLSARNRWAFPRRISRPLRKQINRYARDLFE